MDSMPPAITTSASPEAIIRAASITEVRPERHTLLTLCAGVPQPIPAPSAAWRAGFWPEPAGSTCPMITASTAAASTPPRPSAPSIAKAPSCGAGTEDSAPWRRPWGVRAAVTITISVMGALPAVTAVSAVIVPHPPRTGRPGSGAVGPGDCSGRGTGGSGGREGLHPHEHPRHVRGGTIRIGADGGAAPRVRVLGRRPGHRPLDGALDVLDDAAHGQWPLHADLDGHLPAVAVDDQPVAG